jgi:hypothetical protein
MRHRIYIPLAGQPSVLRPSEAKAVGNGHFAVSGPVAAGERWQFMPGELVECESRTLPDGSKGLVAVSSVLADPEDRSRRTVYGWCGAFVGGIFGLWTAIWLGVGGVPLLLVAATCSIVFAWCSMRWGDYAWEILSKLLG